MQAVIEIDRQQMHAEGSLPAFEQELLALLPYSRLQWQKFDPGPGQQGSLLASLHNALFVIEHLNLDADQLRKGDGNSGQDGRVTLLHGSIVVREASLVLFRLDTYPTRIEYIDFTWYKCLYQ